MIYFLLITVPIGYFVPRRTVAILTYLLIASFLFSYQTLAVLLTWMSGATGLGGASAFGPAPDPIPITYSGSELAAYGIVNLVITLVGIGLVLLGSRLRARKRNSHTGVDVGSGVAAMSRPRTAILDAPDWHIDADVHLPQRSRRQHARGPYVRPSPDPATSRGCPGTPIPEPAAVTI